MLKSIPRSIGLGRPDFRWGAVESRSCPGLGITVVPESNGHIFFVGPRPARVAMWAHHRIIRFTLGGYLNLLDLHRFETQAEWTCKTAIFIGLGGQIAHATPLWLRGFGH